MAAHTLFGKLIGSPEPLYAKHRVTARFAVRAEWPASAVATSTAPSSSSPLVVPTLLDVPTGGDGAFSLLLPELSSIVSELTLQAVAPDGRILGALVLSRDAAVSAMHAGTLIEIRAAAVEPFMLSSLPPDALLPPMKLRGFVFDANGPREASGISLVLWGRELGESPREARPLLSATTDAHGYFSAPLPSGVFAEAYAVVAAGHSQRVLIPLDEAGRFPNHVMLAVHLPDPSSDASDAAGDCGCHAPVGRQPDSLDLTTRPGSYSQDVGGRCVDFTVPNRALEEFSFYTVVRTTEPQIQGLSLDEPALASVDPELFIPVITQAFESAKAIESLFSVEASNGSAAANTGTDSDVNPNAPRIGFSESRTRAPAAGTSSVGGARAPNAVALSAALQGIAAGTYRDHASELAAALSGPEPLDATSRVLTKMTMAAASSRLSHLGSLLFRPPSGRFPASAKHPVLWDDHAKVYQATTIAHGHLLHFKQTWVADGYSLGDLLYSLPLAPNQKKQVAVVDWTRRDAGRRSESLEAQERLDAILSHDRDVTEVVNSTLRESMRGGSRAGTWGVAGGMGGAGSFTTGALNLGAVFGVSGGGGGSSSSAWQDNSRDLGASALQSLRDTTLQAASATRSQRASVVKTVDEGEAIRVQTEVIHNHNHCHAITIQYFEVLRHLQVRQHLADVQECLFVPLLMTLFDEEKILRWRTNLTGALREFSLMRAFEAVERRASHYKDVDFPEGRFADEPIFDFRGELRLRFQLARPKDDFDDLTKAWVLNELRWSAFFPFLPGMWNLSYLMANFFAGAEPAERDRVFQERIAPEIARGVVDKLELRFVSNDGVVSTIPADFSLISHYHDDASLYVTIRPTGTFAGPRRADVRWVEIACTSALPSTQSRIIVDSGRIFYSTAHLETLLFDESGIDNDLTETDTVRVACPLGAEELRNPKKEDDELARKLRAHLNEHMEYYHRAIWWSMDDNRRYMLLDGIEAPNSDGRSVASVVENRLIGIVGNSLVLPVAPGVHLDPTYAPEIDEKGAKKWPDLINLYAPPRPIEPMRISLPTRGVYTEAVMGACNSCEEKDETRFWRYEEAPSGDEPTPIQSPSTDSRRSDTGGLTPTALPNPIINIQNAPAAPDPSGVAAALRTIATASAFPSLTGLDQNQKNALAAFQTAMQGAEYFGGTAADLAKSAGAGRIAGGGGSSPTVGTIDKTMQTIDKAQASGHLSTEQAGTLKEAAIKKMAGIDTPSDSDLKRVQSAQAEGLITNEDARDISASILRKQAGVDDTQRLTDDPDVSQLLQAAAGDGRAVSLSRLGEGVEVSALAANAKNGTADSAEIAAVSPFAVEPFDPAFNRSKPGDAGYAARVASLQAELDKVIKSSPDFTNLGVALIDLTGSGLPGFENPIYAGWNDTHQFGVGSLSKLGILYSAYELRRAVKAAGAISTASSPAAFFKQIEAAWKPAIARSLDPLGLFGAPPAFSKIFTATPVSNSRNGWVVDFTSFGQALADSPGVRLMSGAKATDAAQNTLRWGAGFRQRLMLCANLSHNAAANTCLEDLGFMYINGSLRAAGLLDPNATTEGAGIWVGGPYGSSGGWSIGPSAGKLVGPGTLCGTAKAYASMLALLADDNLVDSAFLSTIPGGVTSGACAEMKEMLRDGNGWWRSELASAGHTPTAIFSKDGSGDVSVSEAAVIERTVGSSNLRYVAVVICPTAGPGPTASAQTVTGFGSKTRTDLIVLLDQIILDANK